MTKYLGALVESVNPNCPFLSMFLFKIVTTSVMQPKIHELNASGGVIFILVGVLVIMTVIYKNVMLRKSLHIMKAKVKGKLLNAHLIGASTSETSVKFYQTTRHNNPEDSHLHMKFIRQ
jgi:hypothetical protein